MENTISKKSIKELQKNVEHMSNEEFREQANVILQSCVKSVDSLVGDNKEATRGFCEAANKEIDVLTAMINSDEYTTEDKKQFATRIAKLVNKFHTNKLITNISVIGCCGLGIGVLATLIWKAITDK